jgi:isoprenylcysteine carboxyl methyltransferase (ICMT) family protein YpbQ
VTVWTPPGSPVLPTPSDRAARRRGAIELGVLQALYLLFLGPWFLVGIGGAMGMANVTSFWAALPIYAWFGYPFVAVTTTVVAWVLFATRHLSAARWTNRVPLLWVVVGVGLLTWVFTVG